MPLVPEGKHTARKFIAYALFYLLVNVRGRRDLQLEISEDLRPPQCQSTFQDKAEWRFQNTRQPGDHSAAIAVAGRMACILPLVAAVRHSVLSRCLDVSSDGITELAFRVQVKCCRFSNAGGLDALSADRRRFGS